MQIRNGKIYVSNGSITVNGVGVDWDNVTNGCLFATVGDSRLYWINNVDTVSDPPTLTLAAPYQGNTISSGAATAGNYVIHRDFTSKGLPLMTAGDIETALLFSRAMQILDSEVTSVQSGGSAATGITFAQNAHGFPRGALIRLVNATTWERCDGASISTAVPDAVVVEGVETDANSFKYSTSGFVNVDGISLVVGTLYGAKDAPGGGYNSGDSNLGVSSSATSFIPALKAISTSTAVVVNIGGTDANVFPGGDATGLVPATGPGGATGKFLKDDGTWDTVSVGAGVVNYDSLYKGVAENADHAHADWDGNFWDAWINGTHEDADEKSVYWAIMNLYNRVLLREAVGNVLREKVFAGEVTHVATHANSETNGIRVQTFVVPAGVNKIKMKVYGGAQIRRQTGAANRFGHYVVAVVTVTPGETLTLSTLNLSAHVYSNGSVNYRQGALETAAPPTTVKVGSTVLISVPGPPAGIGGDPANWTYYSGVSTPTIHSTLGELVSSVSNSPPPAVGELVHEAEATYNTNGSVSSYAFRAASGVVAMEWVGA